MPEDLIKAFLAAFGPIFLGMIAFLRSRASSEYKKQLEELRNRRKADEEKYELEKHEVDLNAATTSSLIRLIEKQTDNVSQISISLKGVRRSAMRLTKTSDELSNVVSSVMSLLNEIRSVVSQMRAMQDDQNDRLSDTMQYFIEATKGYENVLVELKSRDDKTDESIDKLIMEIQEIRKIPALVAETSQKAAEAATLAAISRFEARIMEKIERLGNEKAD